MAKAKAARQGGGGSLVWLQGLACGAMAALAPASAGQLAALLAPAIAALFLDRNSGKPIARAMLLFGLAASVEPVRLAWVAGRGGGFERLMDPDALLPAWLAAAAGWLLAQAVPVVVGVVIDAGKRTRASALQEARATLVAAWGLEEEPADQ